MRTIEYCSMLVKYEISMDGVKNLAIPIVDELLFGG